MNLFGLLCLLVSTVLVNGSIQSNDKKIISSKQYLLTFPQILSSTGNKICLTLLDGYVPEEKDLRVISSDAENRTVFSETFRVEKDTQCFALETKDIKSTYVNLRVRLGADIDVAQIVPFQPSYGMSMIETSKPVYQPGENLRFRVIGFDGSMKPLRSDFVSIALLNPENVKIMEWPGKALEKGMNHYETELSSNNKEGIWKIVGLTKSGEAVEKLFQVAKKIQPEVVLRITQGEKFIVANEDKHRMVVCAEDKHGARLNGGLVNVKVGNHLVIRENPLEEDGCVHFHLKNETFRFDALVGKNIQGSIEYINRETGVREYIPFYLPVVLAQVHLRVPSSALVKSYYKSGLPYFGYLIVETPNYTPLANAEVEICFKIASKPFQFEDSHEKSCKILTSSANGLIKYVIPPVPEFVKQIIVEASIPGVADHKQTFVINPWVEQSATQFIIKPILRIDSCESMPEATQFTVIMTRNGTALFNKLYLQSAGRVSSAQTKSVKLTPTPYVPESDILIGNWPESAEIYSANIYREIDAESDKHSVMNRIVMYGLDSNGNLISDSVAYLKDCLKDESLMSVNVDKNNRIAVDLKVPQGVPCSVAVGTSAERGRLTEQKINKLLEKFDDIYAKSFEWDRCSLAKLERNTNRPLIADFKNNWDTFKEMGLRAVYTKSDIFNKSCDWEVFDEATVNKSLQGLLAVQHTLPYPEHIMTSLADSANMAQLNQLENSLINDVLFWGPKENLQDFLKSLKESDLAGKSEIAVHAICMDQVRGVRSHSVVKRLNTQPIYMQHDLPIIIYQDTIQNVSLYIKRDQSSMKQTECIPVELVFERSDAYEIVSEAQPRICSCSKVTKVPLRIKALKTGPLNLKVVARFSSSLASAECTSEIESFEPQQVAIRTRVESYNPKITLRKYELACKNLPKARIGSDDDETILIAQDLANIFIKQIRDDKSIRTDILEVLARFNGLADMYIRNEKKLPRSLSRSMVGDLYKLVEELSHYKLPRGPFSFNSGNQRVPSLVATSLAYKAIAKIQDKLPQFSGADLLTESFEFIAGSMMKDGCFRPKTYSNMPINLWPFDHQVSPKELTAFVASTLVEVKQTPRIVLKRCLKCIDNLEAEQSDYLTRAMTAFLYAKMNRTESAKKLIRDLESELTTIQNRGERRIPERFMSEAMDNLKSNDENLRALAYLVKAKLALNQTESIEQHIQKLIGSNLSLNDPLIVDTIVEAWRILSTGDKSVIAEIDSKRISLEKFEMKKIELPQEEKSLDFDSSKGCLILERVREIPVSKYERNYPVSSEEKREDSWELKKGETPAPYIRRGFKVLKSQRGSDESCSTRRITVCVDENLKEQRSFTVVAPNYVIDSNRLDRMMIAHETPISSYQINEYSSSLIIAPLKDACFVVPLVKQGEMVEEEVKAYIIKINKNDKPTVGSIQIQKECSVRARRAAPDQSNSSASTAKPNRSSGSQQPNNNQGRDYANQVEEQQTYQEPYPAPAYEAPVKGYAPAPAPTYEPAYPAPAYEAPVKGYAPAPAPAYAPPAYEPTYQAPAYEAPAYQAPAYEAPVKGYAPPPPPPTYEPAYQAPAYEPPVKGYAPPPPPAYAPPAYEAPAYQAPAYEPPAKGYAPPPPPPTYEPAYQAPAYAPPAYAPPAYAPPAYEAPAYQAPAYEPPAKGYAPLPPPPAYAPPTYEAPAYRQTQVSGQDRQRTINPQLEFIQSAEKFYRTFPGLLKTGYFQTNNQYNSDGIVTLSYLHSGRSTQLRYGNSFASNNGQQARNPSNSQRGNSQNQRGYNMNQALPQSRAARPNMWSQNSRGSRMSQRQAAYPVGSNMLRNERFAQASELRGVVECGLQQVASSCPVCLPRLEVSMLDNMCNSTSVLSIIKPTQIKKEQITCGTFTVNHSYGKNVNSTNIPEPFTINDDCKCDSLDYSYAIIISDLMKSDETKATRTPKAFGAETTIIPATPSNVQNFATFYATVC
ncbi:uncharacterized protein LOC107366351 isoform X4 [Tetranychus urticae]|uniref:uncharacterized protein LOC107366351 isoform X4 n=1 Tax=Tetranychus urticae TaxID=32264 RepID=UPI00077B88D7|nr:uncharacterized protein LOC107366351 isoform X4 [Tetranychus urticae]